MRYGPAIVTLVMATAALLTRPQMANPSDGYLGVQTCSTSQCHQKPTRPGGPSAYESWDKDPHSVAFTGGKSGRGKRYGLQGAISFKIAKAMGLGDPTTEDACLRCHAGSVQPNHQAVKMKIDRTGSSARLADGVQCEGCHGPGASWRDIHQHNHGEAVRLGMFDLLGPGNASQQCIACHQTMDDKLIAAGHPDEKAFNFGPYAESIKHWGGHFDSDGQYVP